MSIIPVRDLGTVGIIRDRDPTVLPPNAFSDGMNVRFGDNKVERAPIFRTFAGGLAYTTAFCHGLYNQGGFDSVLIVTKDGYIHQYANGADTDISEPGHVSSPATVPYTACTLANCTYINRPDAVPRVLITGAANFVVLPNWVSTTRAASMRAFGSQLVALNLTKAGVNFPDNVKVSDTAAYGAVPSTWDATDTTKLAVENTLSQARTPIVDGGPLGRDFMIYTRDEVWKMVSVGGQFLFEFYRLPFDNVGMINQNCWVEVDGKHYAWSDTDIYVHNGVSKASLMDQRNREAFFKELNVSRSNDFFAAHDKQHGEVLFCCVSGYPKAALPTPDHCNYAAVYNYRNDTWSFRDLPNVTSATTANANTVYTYANVPGSLTYDNVGGSYYDQEDSFSRFCLFTVTANSALGLGTQDRVDVLDFADKGKLALPIDSSSPANPKAWMEQDRHHFDEAGTDIRPHKLVRSIAPLGSSIDNGTYLVVRLAGSNGDTPGTLEPSGSALQWHPLTDGKLDKRVEGRFVTLYFEMTETHDFSLAGYDLDVIVTGRR